MRPRTILLALLFTALPALPAWSTAPEDILDKLLDARADGDAEAFLAHMATDAIVFGLRGSGPLTGPALSGQLDALFSATRAVSYRSVQRDIRYSGGGDVAWFSELLEEAGDGKAWGSGVMVRAGTNWRVTQYATAPITTTVSAAPKPVVGETEPGVEVTVLPVAPAETAPTGRSAGDQPETAGAAAEPATAEPGKKKNCRRMRHKTNRASNC